MTKQVVAKLPDRLMDRIDELVAKGTCESRSHAVRKGLELFLASAARAEMDRRYREGYESFPETAEEIEEAERLAVRSIHDEPWERWW